MDKCSFGREVQWDRSSSPPVRWDSDVGLLDSLGSGDLKFPPDSWGSKAAQAALQCHSLDLVAVKPNDLGHAKETRYGRYWHQLVLVDCRGFERDTLVAP